MQTMSTQLSQTLTFMNTFDLYIESLRIQHRGYFYIQWRRGKKSTQTLKHESQGKITMIRETLVLNITLCFRNGRSVEKNTVLSVMDQEGKQIDQITLAIHKWNQEYSSLEVPLAKGILRAKVRRHQLMQISNPPQNVGVASSDVEEQSWYLEEEINMNMMRSETLSKQSRVQIDSHRDEVAKIRKQLEDSLYVNNKLKNDRSVLLTRNLELESELTQLKRQAREQIEKLEKHYNTKIEIRQTIYEDEINNMITVFNGHADNNLTIFRKIMSACQGLERETAERKLEAEGLERDLEDWMEKVGEIQVEKEALRGQIGNMGLIIQQLKQDKERNNQLLIEAQGQNFNILKDKEAILSQLQTLKQQHDSDRQIRQQQLDQNRQTILQLQTRLCQLQQQIEINRSELQFTDQSYRKQKEQSQNNQQAYRSHIKMLQQKIKHNQFELTEKQEQIRVLVENQTNMQKYKREVVGLRGQLEMANSDKSRLEQELKTQKEKHEKYLRVLQEQNENSLNSKLEEMMNNSIVMKEKQITIENLKSEVGSLRHSVADLTTKIQDLIAVNTRLKEQKQFFHENAIKVEQHEQLQTRVAELEAKISEYELHYQHLQFSSFDKENPDMQFTLRNKNKFKEADVAQIKEEIDQSKSIEASKQKPKQKQQEQLPAKQQKSITLDAQNSFRGPSRRTESNISSPSKSEHKNKYTNVLESGASGEAMNFLQQLEAYKSMVESLEQQNQELKSRQEMLVNEIQQLGRKQQQLIKRLSAQEMKIVQYCESQQEQNLRLEQEYFDKLTSSKQLSKLRPNDQFEEASSRQEPHQKMKLSLNSHSKHSASNAEGNSRHLKIAKSSSLQMDMGKLKKPKLLNGNTVKEEAKIHEQVDQQSLDREVEVRENPDSMSVRMKFSSPGNHSVQNKSSPKRSQKSQILSKISQIRVELGEQIREGMSNRSARSRQKSRESYVSGSTLYKFNKISHKQKIKKLQAEIQQYRELFNKNNEKQAQLYRQMEKYKEKFQQIERQLKLIQEDRLTLRTSLHFQLQKKNVPKLNRNMQTQEPERVHRSVQANIVLEDPQKLALQQELLKLNKANSEISFEMNMKLQEADVNHKLLSQKLEQADRRHEETSKKYMQKNQQLEKLKKQFKSLQLKDSEQRSLYHTLKLQKTQTDFEVQRMQNQVKRQKARIEQLQEKVRKNDVIDQLRQAQFEIQTFNKKIVDFNRQVYQLKLEKDTLDDEIKITRKKNSDNVKKTTELEDTVQRLQKSIQQMKRRQSRARRQLEDRQDSIQKQKDQIKRLQQQISMLKSIGNQTVFERKKHVDEINTLQSALERKQYQISNLKKEIQKMRLRLLQKEEEKTERKSNLKKQIDRLESQLSSKNKQIIQLESTVKQVSNRLELLNSQNKKSISEKSSLYSQKLKAYIEQIADIKKLLDDNTIENNNLKYRLGQSMEQLETLGVNYGRLEQRYNELMAENKDLMAGLQNQRLGNEKGRQKLVQMETEIEGLRNMLKQVKVELEREKKQGLIRREQIQQLTKAKQNLLSQLNRNKVKLSDYETTIQISKNYSQKLSDTDRQLRSINKQLRETKNAYDQYRSKYVHTSAQLQSALRQADNKWKQKLQSTIDILRAELQMQQSMDKKKYEVEIIDLLNESTRLRTESQKKSEEISQLCFKLSKLQIMPMKMEQIQKLYEQKSSECNRYRAVEQANLGLTDKASKLEDALSRALSDKKQLSASLQEQKTKSKQLHEALSQAQLTVRSLQQQSLSLQAKLGQSANMEQSLKLQLQRILNINRSIEQDKNSLLRRMEESRKQYNEKIQILEDKLDLMGETVTQHEKALSTHYEKNIEEAKLQLQHMLEQLQAKQNAAHELEEVVSKLELQCEGYKKQIMSLRDKQASDAEIFELEYNKIKGKLTENDRNYKETINSLEQELEQMSREMTSMKMRNMSASPAPMQVPTEDSAVVSRRQEEKNRVKDAKIEELKQNVYVLEETIVKMKRKETSVLQHSEKLARLQKQNAEYQAEIKRLQEQLLKLKEKDVSVYQSLKTEITHLKSQAQRVNALLQQKQMELQSVRYQLQTTKQLYNELQRELEKRKNLLREKNQNEDQFNKDLHEKMQYIGQLEQNAAQLRTRNQELSEQLARKTNMIAALEQKTQNYENLQSKLKSTSKLTSQGQHYRSEIRRLSQQNQSLHKSNKALKQQLVCIQKDHEQTLTKLSLNQSSMDSLSISLEQLTLKCKEQQTSLRKYNDMNQACMELFHMGLQQAVYQGHIAHKLEQKDNQINGLLQEVEQLKFLNERRAMDFAQMKREHYQLQLKLEDAEFTAEQVDQLRIICDKLEQEKKEAVYREEVLRVQLQSVVDGSPGEVRDRLDKIKVEEVIKRVGQRGNMPRITFS